MFRRALIRRNLALETMATGVVNMQYAIRGPLTDRAAAIQEELKSGAAPAGKYNFDNVVFCNTGNPQAHKQQPLTFPREVLALLSAPHLIEGTVSEDTRKVFSADAIERAQEFLRLMATGTGSYTHSQGYPFVRKHVAEFITARDNAGAGKELRPATADSVFLTDGASRAVQFLIQALVNGPTDGIMIPIPQYPLYTATLAQNHGAPIKYFLDESKGWSMTVEDLEQTLAKAEKDGVTGRALVIINPGNPTGQVLDKSVMVDVVKFCLEHKLLLIADEVYQENVYAEGKKFHSFREVALGMGEPYASQVQIASLHSTSKGMWGECGRRGGYMQVDNFNAEALAMFAKLPSICLCPNVGGQIITDLMVNPPKPGDASYDSFKAEYDAIFQKFKSRSEDLVSQLNVIPGIHAQPAEGAMYAYPTLELPEKFKAAAKAENRAPDQKWAFELLEDQGVVIVPGTGFGQKEGTNHFRTTILPPQLGEVSDRIAAFQKKILEKYA